MTALSVWRSRQDPYAIKLGVDAVQKTSDEDWVPLYSPKLGPTEAKYRIIVFSSFGCPSCRQQIPSLIKYVADDSRFRLVYRHLPVGIGIDAEAAGAALGDSPKFWKYASRIWSRKTSSISSKDVLDALNTSSADTNRIVNDLKIQKNEYVRRVRLDHSLAIRLNIRSVPVAVVLRGEDVLYAGYVPGVLRFLKSK